MRNVIRIGAAIAFVLPLATVRAQLCDTTGAVVQVLGSGGPRINRERASASYLVRLDGKARILIDAGGGAFLRFGQAGATLEDLWLIGISHLHPDHVADLTALLWLSNLARRDSLPIAGPSGGAATPEFEVFLRRLFDERTGAFPLMGATMGGAGMGVPLSVIRLDLTRSAPSPVMENASVSVSGIAVPHGNVPTIAYKVRAGGATIVFGSDQTGTNPAFVEFARGADLLVMHLTIGAGETHPLHAAPAVVGQVARDAGVRRLILSHLGAFALDAAVADVRKAYTGRVVVGTDLQCTPARP